MSERQYIRAENIKMKFGDREIFHIDRLSIYEGEKIGLVGVNGAGKTTLLRILSGELSPDCGTVKSFCQPFFFRQFAKQGGGDKALGQDCGMGDLIQCKNMELDRYCLDGKVLSDLHIKDKVWAENVSGGEETRLRLAEVFSNDRPLVFLDEPTANLDCKGIEVLKRKLGAIETMVLISHDRALLNSLCTRILALEQGRLTSYDGNYDDYVEQKQAAVARQWTEYELYTAEKRRLEKVFREKKEHAKQIEKRPRNMSPREAGLRNFLSHHPKDAKARKMEKAAANVQQRILAMEVKEKPRELPKIRPDFRLTDPPENKIVIHGENFSFAYGDGSVIFQDATFNIANHSRVAIIGDNGAGKTTLLHLICGKLAPGEVYVVPKAKIGLLEQNLTTIDYMKTVLGNVMEVSVQRESIARTVLSRLLFFEDDMKKPAGILSGGERIKLAFAKLFVSQVNLLVLDEPTNFLDIPSIEALESMFCEYGGTLVFVSHDKEFIRKVATDILEVKDGKILHMNREFEQF
ncbi:MAG: ABC-F type ribosomal protection protein [Lachnospiraceae bacterium]|nr:ABC-F type ribosomal protection protein [Lachnospiraceae bacterium]